MNTVLNIMIVAAILAFVAFLAGYFLDQGGEGRLSRAVWIGAAILLIIACVAILAGWNLVHVA